MLATFDLSIPVGLLIRTMTADLIGYSCCSNGATTEVNLNFFQLKCCTILHFYWPISSCTPDFSFRKMPNVRCIVSNHRKIIFLYILFSVLQNPIMINVPSRMTPFQIKIWCCCYNKLLHIRFQQCQIPITAISNILKTIKTSVHIFASVVLFIAAVIKAKLNPKFKKLNTTSS